MLHHSVTITNSTVIYKMLNTINVSYLENLYINGKILVDLNNTMLL